MTKSGDEPSLFLTTQWTTIREAFGQSECALADLCEIYWRPLYRYARRRGQKPCDAEDLVQGFFSKLMQREKPPHLSPTKGTFRSYLLAAFKKHMAGEWRMQCRQKRGSGIAPLSLDWSSEENGLQLQASETGNPDHQFDRDWAQTLLDRVLDLVAQEFVNEGKEDEFQAMRGYLAVGCEHIKFAQLAERLDISEGAARVAVHRLRKRYRQRLRQEIARTLSTQEAVDEEMQALFQALTTC